MRSCEIQNNDITFEVAFINLPLQNDEFITLIKYSYRNVLLKINVFFTICEITPLTQIYLFIISLLYTH